MRRIFTALAIFTVATSLLALAEAEKPVAVLKQTLPNANQPARPEPPRPKPIAKKYLPMPHFGGY